MTCYGTNHSPFVFRNNIIQFNEYGFVCPPNMLAPNSGGNVIVDNRGVIAGNGYPKNIPQGNAVVSSLDAVGFVNYAQGDWRLTPQAKAKLKGAGVDFDALGAAVSATDVEAPYFGKKRK